MCDIFYAECNFRSLGSCAHIASVLLGMGVDPEERTSYKVNDSVALTAKSFLEWEDQDTSSSDPDSDPPIAPTNRKRSRRE